MNLFDFVVFPKVNTKADVERINEIMSEYRSTKAVLCIESPQGLINLKEICESNLCAEALIVASLELIT